MNIFLTFKTYYYGIIFPLIVVLFINTSCSQSDNSSELESSGEAKLFIPLKNSESIDFKKLKVDFKNEEILEEKKRSYGGSLWEMVNIFYENYKWGLKNKDEEIIIEAIYDDIKIQQTRHPVPFVILKKDNKWGIVELLKVYTNEYYKLVNGKIIIPFDYEDIKYNSLREKYSDFLVKTNGKWGAISSKGEKIISPKYDSILPFYQYENYRTYTIAYLNGKCGIIDTKTDAIAIPFIYDEISKKYDENYSKVKLNGKTGIINMKNNILVPIKFEDLYYLSPYLSKAKLNNKWGIIDSLGNEIFAIKYDSIDFPGESFFIRHNNDLNKGYLGSAGFHDITKVRLNNKWGLINTSGEIIVPVIYDSIHFRGYQDHYKIFKNGKIGVANRNGNIVLASEYEDYMISEADKFLDEVDYYRDWMHDNVMGDNKSYIIAIKNNDEWRFIKRNGEITSSLKYEK